MLGEGRHKIIFAFNLHFLHFSHIDTKLGVLLPHWSMPSGLFEDVRHFLPILFPVFVVFIVFVHLPSWCYSLLSHLRPMPCGLVVRAPCPLARMSFSNSAWSRATSGLPNTRPRSQVTASRVRFRRLPSMSMSAMSMSMSMSSLTGPQALGLFRTLPR